MPPLPLPALALPALLLLALLPALPALNVLSTADFGSYQSSGYVFTKNFAGSGVSFANIYLSAMNSSLFQGYFAQSKAFGSTFSMMSLSVKMQLPKGYKYNCAGYSAIGINATCTYNYQPIITRLSAFTRAAGPYTNSNVAIGFDMEGANFSNSNFVSYFTTFLSAINTNVGTSFYLVPIELVDGADAFAANNVSQNYSAANFVSDMTVALGLSGTKFYGPGVSQDADPSWMDTYSVLSKHYNFVFTLKCAIFSSSNFTVGDVLAENNYRNYILSRLTSRGQTLNPAAGSIAISELKLTSAAGVDGVTNAFVSALWAVDFSFEFAMFGGKGVKFVTDVTAGSLQTLIGPAPTYTPAPMYYAMLLLSVISYVQPTVGMPQVTAGSSSAIKVYGFAVAAQMQVVMINKDTNSSASGVVQLLAQSNDVMKCLYLSAPALSATSGVSWAGYSFAGGSSVPQGSYALYSYFPASYGVYNIPLNYSQAALCYFGNPAQNFPVLAKGEGWLALALLALLAALL